jgi:2-octaprenyl-6-methoxyphenol hydroxylase
MLAHRLSAGRGVLIGEAAHRCHPIGGQGLNLCWRDVDVLLKAVKRGGRPSDIARRYARKRWMDLVLVGMATDLLVRLFSNRNRVLLPIRRLAIGLLAFSSNLRTISLRAMSDGPMHLVRALPD